MDERMWLLAYDARLMFSALKKWEKHREPAGQRKFRLIAAAFCRAVEGHYRKYADAVERVTLAEQAADDPALVVTLPVPDVAWLPRDDADDEVWALRATWAVVTPEAFQAAYTCYDLARLVLPTVSSLTYRWMAHVIRCAFGNPFQPVTFDPAWRTSTTVALAQGIYNDRAFDQMPILADALQDAGCDNTNILSHCRTDTVHARGCWVVDGVLGKS